MALEGHLEPVEAVNVIVNRKRKRPGFQERTLVHSLKFSPSPSQSSDIEFSDGPRSIYPLDVAHTTTSSAVPHLEDSEHCVPDIHKDDLSSDPISAPMLTVNSFLNQSARGRTAKRYGRNKTLATARAPTGRDYKHSDGLPFSSPLASASADRMLPPRKNQKRFGKPLAQRLLQAAVYSHVELPQSDYVQDSDSALATGRRPLSFVPVSPPGGIRKRKPCLVDPRRHATDLPSARFVSGGTSIGRLHSTKPLANHSGTRRARSRYRIALPFHNTDQGVPRKPHLPVTSRSQQTHYPPLLLVPLTAHKEALKNKRHSSSSIRVNPNLALENNESTLHANSSPAPISTNADPLVNNRHSSPYPYEPTCLPSGPSNQHSSFNNPVMKNSPRTRDPEKPSLQLTSFMGLLRGTARTVTTTMVEPKQRRLVT